MSTNAGVRVKITNCVGMFTTALGIVGAPIFAYLIATDHALVTKRQQQWLIEAPESIRLVWKSFWLAVASLYFVICFYITYKRIQSLGTNREWDKDKGRTE